MTYCTCELSLRRGSTHLVEAIDLTLEAGRLHLIIGPNGAGKSTLLRLLSGELLPTRGHIRLDGRPLIDWPGRALARRRAVMSQRLPPGLGATALDMVLLGRLPYAPPSFLGGRTSAEDLRIADASMSKVGVLHLAERPFTNLSGGEQQRVHLARVLAQRASELPFSLLLDEPTASLDLGQAAAAFELLRVECRQGLSVIAVVHDLALAARFADTLTLLKAGRVLAHGPTADVLTRELLSEAYDHPLEVVHHAEAGAWIVPCLPTFP